MNGYYVTYLLKFRQMLAFSAQRSNHFYKSKLGTRCQIKTNFRDFADVKSYYKL